MKKEKQHTEEMQEALAKSADLERLDAHLSATYLLMSLAIDHFERATDILNKYDLCARELKQAVNGVEHSFDRVEHYYRSILGIGNAKAFAEDFYKYAEQIDEMLNIKQVAE